MANIIETSGEFGAENLYVQSLVKAFKEFIIEESKGYSHSELRFRNKIEAARLLFPEAKQELIQFGNQIGNKKQAQNWV